MEDKLTWLCQPFSELAPTDMHGMFQLRSRVFVVEQQSVYLDLDGKDPMASHLLLKAEDGEVIACCRLLPPGVSYKEASIGRVVIHPDWRGRGLARELIRRALEQCRTLFERTAAIRISAQKHLKDFYAAHGFKVCTGDYLEDGILHVGMIREGEMSMPASSNPIIACYLGHSAWLVTTGARCLVFDYGLRPQRPATGHLSDGILNLDELPELPLYCFSSHRHGDHYSAALHREFSEKINARFILGLDEQPDCAAAETLRPGTVAAWPHRVFTLDDMKIHCSGSTDSGVSFLIETPEAVIYHGGDLAFWDDDEFFRRVYHQEIDWLARTGVRPDLAMLPVSTSDGYQESALLSGLWYFFERLSPAAVLPMHAHGFEPLYEQFAALARARGLTGIYTARTPGQRLTIPDVNSIDIHRKMK